MSNSYRPALRRVLLTGATATALALSGVAAAKEIWNFNMFGGKRAMTAGIETIKDLSANDLGEAFSINLQYGDALGNNKQNPENIKSGVFEAGQICVGYYPNKFPLLSVMELPFLAPRDLATRAKVELDVLSHPAIVAEMEGRWNMLFFGPSFLPAYEFMGNKRIATTDDMKGVKMRISGLNATVLQDFGAVPTNVTAPEGYEALRRGTIDSFGFPYSYAFGAYKLYEVSKYVTEGLGMSGFMCFQGVNKDAWDRAPEAVRSNMPKYQAAATEAMIKAYEEADEKWRPIFRERLEVVEVDPAVRARLAAGSQKVWDKWVTDQEDAGRPGRAVLDFVKASVAKHSQ